MTVRNLEEIRRIIFTVRDLFPDAHSMLIAHECRQRYGLNVTGSYVDRVIRHQSVGR